MLKNEQNSRFKKREIVITDLLFYREMLKTRPVRLNLLLASSLIFSIATFYFMELAVMNEVKANRVPSESDTASIPCVVVGPLQREKARTSGSSTILTEAFSLTFYS